MLTHFKSIMYGTALFQDVPQFIFQVYRINMFHRLQLLRRCRLRLQPLPHLPSHRQHQNHSRVNAVPVQPVRPFR